MLAMLTALVLLGLSLTLMSSALAGSARCTTHYDEDFRRYLTECSDGWRAITRYDADFKRWRTDITIGGGERKTPGWYGPPATHR